MEFFLDKFDSIKKYFAKENVLIILLGMKFQELKFMDMILIQLKTSN